MDDTSTNLPGALDARSASESLNQRCFCVTLDRDKLFDALDREIGDPAFAATFIRSRPHLFSNTPVFLAKSDTDAMLRIVRAIEAAARLPGYRAAVLSWAPPIARHDSGPLGVFMGYDFHLSADGPKLIEVNTNAGGAFLNALLVKAQRACCTEVEFALNRSDAGEFEAAVLRMFAREWALEGRSGMPRRIAIVDEKPEEQYLYPEFMLAKRFFHKHGIDAVIADAALLRYEDGGLSFDGQPVDLVYNRSVDFAFDDPAHDALRRAYLDGAAVVTPNPHIHALYADKRNLALLSDRASLQAWGLAPDMLGDLAAGVPRTVPVTAENAPSLWVARKTLFFKPYGGHGGKAVYRGDKLTKGVWATIAQGGYVAQDFAAPSERTITLDGLPEIRKTDVRLYVHEGRVLLTAARLYQGQTTNFRTPGGGFAPVFVN